MHGPRAGNDDTCRPAASIGLSSGDLLRPRVSSEDGAEILVPCYGYGPIQTGFTLIDNRRLGALRA